eukprot:scaffold31472_cov49-Phaeocystis_antarctica.AAC.1
MAGGSRAGGGRGGGGPGRATGRTTGRAAGCAAARELPVEALELLRDLELLGQLGHELAHLRWGGW